MALDAARYTTGMRYDPTRSTGRYPVAPDVGPLAPPTTDPVAPPPAPLPAPAPEAPPPVSAGSVPLGAGGEGMQGGGVDPLGGMPGPSPDQSLDAMGRAALTGLGFAVSPMSSFAGLLAGLAYDGIKGNVPGTTTGLRGILADQLGLGGKSGGPIGDEVGMTGDSGLGKPDALGPDMGVDYGAVPGPAKGDYGFGGDADDGGGPNGSTASDATGTGGADGGYAGADTPWQSGGYTGAGDDAMVQPDAPAGTVHEGEVVLSAPAVDYYGPELLLLLNDMAIPRSRLAALVQGQ